MPQVRDPKTGRYTSEGGSSSGTNHRIQKAKAIGSGNKPVNPLPQLDEYEEYAVDRIILHKEHIAFNAPVVDVPLTNLRSMQKTLRKGSVKRFSGKGKSKGYPTILNTANGYNVVLDGNHRVLQALKNRETTIKAHYSTVADFNKE